VPLSPKSVLGT